METPFKTRSNTRSERGLSGLRFVNDPRDRPSRKSQCAVVIMNPQLFAKGVCK